MIWMFVLIWVWASAAAASAVDFYIEGRWKTRLELNIGLLIMFSIGPLFIPFLVFLTLMRKSRPV